jgi:hypothetical protein
VPEPDIYDLKLSQVHRTPSLLSNIPLDDNLAVGIGNLYALRLENIPENQQRLSADVGNAVLGIGDPKAENKLQRTVAECRQVTDNSALRQNPFKFRDGVNRKPAYCMRIIKSSAHSSQATADREFCAPRLQQGGHPMPHQIERKSARA